MRTPARTVRKAPSKPQKSIYERITKRPNPRWADKLYNKKK